MASVKTIPPRLTALLALLVAADAAAADEVRFRLINGTDFPIRAVVLSAYNRGWKTYGIQRGYEGLLCPEHLGPESPGRDVEAEAVAYAKQIRAR